MAKVKLNYNLPVSGETADLLDINIYDSISLATNYGGYGYFDRNGGRIDGKYYPHVLDYSLSNSAGTYNLEFGGNVSYSINNSYYPNYEVTGGVINHVRQTVNDYNNGLYAVFDITDASYDAKSFQKAANTKSNSDDLAILKSMLSGDDSFDLYYEGNIKAYGYEGNDTFIVDSINGVDVIDGGPGSDSISYNFNLS